MTWVFIIVGLIMWGITAAIYFLHRSFFANGSHTVTGVVVENIESEYTSKDAFGRVHDVTPEHHITIEFCTNKRYRFDANISHFTEDNRVGAKVAVVLNKKYPNTAKLASASSGYALIAKLFGALGCIFLFAGIWLLDIKQLRHTFANPFAWLWLLGAVIFCAFIAGKVYILSQNHPLFTPNMVEVDDTLSV